MRKADSSVAQENQDDDDDDEGDQDDEDDDKEEEVDQDDEDEDYDEDDYEGEGNEYDDEQEDRSEIYNSISLPIYCDTGDNIERKIQILIEIQVDGPVCSVYLSTLVFFTLHGGDKILLQPEQCWQ